MKFIKLYESFTNIDNICIYYNIKNYTINSDGIVDVDGDVNIYNKKLTKLPLKFGNVTGNFYCNYNELISLEGCPKLVGGVFDCANNILETLEGCTQILGGSFHFTYNEIRDLYGFPEFFDGDVYYNFNPVSEILDLFKTKLPKHCANRLGKVIDLLNEYWVIQQDGTLVILDRLEEVFYMLGIDIPEEISLKNYEVY